MPNRIRTWGPAAGWAAVLFLLSSTPDYGVGVGVPHADKVAHVVLYSVLGATLAHAGARSPRRVAPWALVLAGALYGVTDELHQLFVPGRDADVFDWIADVVGVVAGFTVWTRLRVEADVTAREKPEG